MTKAPKWPLGSLGFMAHSAKKHISRDWWTSTKQSYTHIPFHSLVFSFTICKMENNVCHENLSALLQKIGEIVKVFKHHGESYYV